LGLAGGLFRMQVDKSSTHTHVGFQYIINEVAVSSVSDKANGH
jgi:hypothetical protein